MYGLIRYVVAFLFFLLTPFSSMANEEAVIRSLNAYLSHIVLKNGETVELVRVENLPALSMAHAITWSFPTIQGYPERISLIAEQRTSAGLRRWYVPVKLRWWGEGVALQHSVVRGQVIQSSQLESKRLELTGCRGVWLKNKNQVVGLRAIRPIAAGEPILAHMLKRPPVIQRGDVVTLLFRSGRIVVKSKAKALRSAAIGDSLLVRPVNGRETVQGVVVGSHLVRVSYGG